MIGSRICILAVGILAAVAAPAVEVAQVPISATLSAYHADARSVLAEVLSHREFRDLRERQSALAERFQDWIESFFNWLGNRAGPVPDWLRWAFWFWLIGGAVAILGHFGYWLYQSLSPMTGVTMARKMSRDTPHDEILGIRDLDYAGVYSEALRLMREGDWPNAIRYLMVTAILRLDLEGRILRRRFKTNGSYIQELARFPEDQEAFRCLSHLAEPVLYGQLSADKDRCERVVEALSGIVRDGTQSNATV